MSPDGEAALQQRPGCEVLYATDISLGVGHVHHLLFPFPGTEFEIAHDRCGGYARYGKGAAGSGVFEHLCTRAP
jgi:hypothetical protein